MSKRLTSIRLPELTDRQLAELASATGLNTTELLTTAIDRMYQQEIKTMTTPKYDYTVIEDSGGGLQLFLFKPGTDTPVMGFSGFEYSPGSLIASLDSLDTGDDARRWDGKMENLDEQWSYLSKSDYGYQVICHRYVHDTERTIKPERMGKAGQIEFGIETE